MCIYAQWHGDSQLTLLCHQCDLIVAFAVLEAQWALKELQKANPDQQTAVEPV